MWNIMMNKRKLKITTESLWYIQTYIRLVHKHIGPNECGGFLAGEPGSDIVDMALLAPHQTVTPSSVTIDAQGVLAAGREIQKHGKQAKGWWHSHGQLPVFHSSTDDTNTEHILSQIELYLKTFGDMGQIQFSIKHT